MLDLEIAKRQRIENAHIALEVDESGRLVALENRRTGHNYAGACTLWRLYLQIGTEMELEVDPGTNHTPQIETDETQLRLRYNSVWLRGRELAIQVEIVAALKGEDVHWTIHMENAEPGVTVRECHFPLVGNLQITEDQNLIWSKHGGERMEHLRHELSRNITYYMAPDQVYTGLSINYPFPAATNCFTLVNDREGLYVGCHIPLPERTLHQCRLYGGKFLEVGMVRFPNLSTDQSRVEGPFVTSPYSGDWHVAARKYRTWANTWFQPPTPPAWVRRMNGWQRVILQHQYGDIHYRFKQLPQIYTDGADSGINTLFMFGWQRGGMDNNYPDYQPDPRLGSEEEMRRGIDHFNAHDGHVILYANGRLIDRNSDFYRSVGHRIVIRDINGNETPECYKFRGNGHFVYEFSNRTLLPVCPSCPEWFEVLRNLADKALEWNCHSLFLDQAGLSEYPCCDPNHPHPTLAMGLIRDKAETLRRLRDYLRERQPEMALGIELLSDVTAQYADYVHGIEGGCAVPADWCESENKPEPRGFLEWFRYTFPEVILTDREIRDDTDIERRVNHALLIGLRSDVEIYRCRRTITTTPHYARYLNTINQLRQKYAEFLLEGRYVDTDGIECDNRQVDVRAFVNGTKTAVIMTQSRVTSATVHIHLPSKCLSTHTVVGKASVQPQTKAISVTLGRYGLAVLIFEPEESRGRIGLS